MGREIELNGQMYSIGRLSAKQQFHVSRRIAPVIPPMIPAFLKLAEKLKDVKDEDGEAGVKALLAGDLADMGGALQPFADAIAALKDADADYVIDTCLTVVQRRQNTGWARVMSQDKVLMFQEMDMAVILPLVVQVIVVNLGPFIQGLLTSLPSSPQPGQAG